MSCEGKKECPKHGTLYMKRLVLANGDNYDVYCAGCHAGEMAARDEYYRGVVRGVKEMQRRGA